MKIIGRKRRIEGKTNYLKRKRLLEGKKPRLVIRKSNMYIMVQYVESREASDKVKVSIFSKVLLEKGWPKEKEGSLKSLAAGYLTGLIFGKLIKELKEPIVDTGLIRSAKGSRIYATIKGIIDSGIKINCDPKMFPAEERINNEKTKDFFEKVKNNIIGGKTK